MGSSRNSREQELQRQNQAAQNTYNQTLHEYKPSPLEERLNQESMDWLDFTSGKNGPVDYTKAPGLTHLGLYDEGAANRFAERTATGGLQMGRDGANATAVEMRRQQLADQMNEARGENLVNAVRSKDAAVRGQMPFLIGTSEGRNQSRLNSAGSRANAASQNYASYRPSTPWWHTAIGAGIGGLGSFFSGGFASGRS